MHCVVMAPLGFCSDERQRKKPLKAVKTQKNLKKQLQQQTQFNRGLFTNSC